MWKILRSEVRPNFPNLIFYRQWVAHDYILDFYCPTLGLGLEIDGDVHNDQKEYDEERDANLTLWGIQVLRFNNEDVLNNPQIAAKLCKVMQDRMTPWLV